MEKHRRNRNTAGLVEELNQVIPPIVECRVEEATRGVAKGFQSALTSLEVEIPERADGPASQL